MMLLYFGSSVFKGFLLRHATVPRDRQNKIAFYDPVLTISLQQPNVAIFSFAAYRVVSQRSSNFAVFPEVECQLYRITLHGRGTQG